MLLKGLSSFAHTKKITWSHFRCLLDNLRSLQLLLRRAYICGRSSVMFTRLDISSQVAFHACIRTAETNSACRIELQNNSHTLRIYVKLDKVLFLLFPWTESMDPGELFTSPVKQTPAFNQSCILNALRVHLGVDTLWPWKCWWSMQDGLTGLTEMTEDLWDASLIVAADSWTCIAGDLEGC